MEDGKWMQKCKMNLFDNELDEEYVSCIKFRITEIHGTIKKQIDNANGNEGASPEESVNF